MTQFDDIRPYNDDEVRPVLDRILSDRELCHAVASLRFPRLARALPWVMQPLVRSVLRRQLAAVNSVHDFQTVIEKYMRTMIETTTSSLTVSGLDRLDPAQSYLFISNHRDIAMDPAFVNWVLYHNGHKTVRIAIGDNLLTKPYVSDLMRLNKSFIVNRSATSPRDKLRALKHLSNYIYHSLHEDNANIWIAQREGRAKDGLDRTNAALVTMFALSKAKTSPLTEHIRALRIVPVSISYELDPCDAAKASELYEQRSHGCYEKDEHEDVASIAAGIAGQKGHVHVAFGEMLHGDYANTDEVAADIDRQIIQNYVLYPNNCAAYEQLHGTLPPLTVTEKQVSFAKGDFSAELQQFNRRLAAFDGSWRQIALEMYANPVVSKLQFQG
ncbi:cytochrome C oxidase Cbb3 [Exilibacterium tricleocarpae]|uniref:Cytochrome C oxidase Cbb3 n=1 Tax=Exilibacterium tricleocarpae TaxID=2591008 RepID=A0A545TQL0_9GAMM|nr:1-acyl-sn-glycerol-3-phosphate acyltransferase [Exilibacterium tricleocarpae]TQV79497.1 cytochrome C oxidase Cbb3 [Exilibacterium tricleocarpae]